MSHVNVARPSPATPGDGSGVAAVIAMLQSEQLQEDEPSRNKESGPKTRHEQKRKAETSAEVKRNDKMVAALESRAGEAIRSELEVDLLMLKRQKLIKLSKEVLDARCTGFCTKARLTDDEYLREASHALATITKDLDDAACASEVTKASAKRHANEFQGQR